MTRETARHDQASFQAHLDLLRFFLGRRDAVVEHIQGVLNAQRKPVEFLRDGAALARQFEDGFFALPGIGSDRSRLRGRLDEAHSADGFRPRDIPGLYNRLVDPAELMMRGFHLWQQTHWPGRNGRVRFAHTLFDLYVMRCLELLAMRLWDDGTRGVGDRLALVQEVLDQLWAQTPAGQPVLLRDARWLIQLAQSPATSELGPYFEVARNVAETLPEHDRIETHRAGVLMAGGHLRSQLRYHATKKEVPGDENSLILSTRISNALDFALLIQDLVPLLEAYEHACHHGDGGRRVELADAICQGMSPDPDLFLNRIDLLGAYSMIEHLFVTTEPDGQVVYTPMGRRQVQLIEEYDARVGRVAKPLFEDCRRFRPVDGAYSPYGVLYGFSTNLIEHIAFKALQPESVTRFSLEDVFTGGEAGSGKLAWVSGLRKLPHLTPEVAAMFDYPQQFAKDMFGRLEDALRRRVAGGQADDAARTGRLFVVPARGPAAGSEASRVPDVAVRYVRSSDRQLVAARWAEACDEAQLLGDRREGKCLVSYRTSGGWVAVSKAILTEILATGRDARIAGLPPAAAQALKLTCPGLIV